MLTAPFELELKFAAGTEQVFGIRLYSDEHHWTEIGFDHEHHQFYMDRARSGEIIADGFGSHTTAPLAADRPSDLTLVVDRSSIEAFAQGGTIAMTNLTFPTSDRNRVELFSKTGKPIAVRAFAWKLQSVWK